MPYASGLSAQLGFGSETSWGQYTTLTRFVQFVDESIQTEIERLESNSIITGAKVMRSSQWTPALKRSEGDVGFEVMDGSIGMLLHHMMGTVSSTGTSAPFTHVFRPAPLLGKGLTFQVGRPTRAGTVVPFTYAGAKISSWEIGISTGEIATLGISIVAKSETTGIALATPVFDTTIRPMNFVYGSMKIAGTSLCVRSATISGENALDTDRVCLGSDTILEPQENDLSEFTAECEVEWGEQGGGNALELYNRYVNGEEADIELKLQNSLGTKSLTITGRVRFDGETPNVGGREMLTQSVSMKFTGSDSDASAIAFTYVTSDSTP